MHCLNVHWLLIKVQARLEFIMIKSVSVGSQISVGVGGNPRIKFYYVFMFVYTEYDYILHVYNCSV